jgi:hypothetical protein
MARKLLIALWRYVETGTIPAGVEFGGPAIRDFSYAGGASGLRI